MTILVITWGRMIPNSGTVQYKNGSVLTFLCSGSVVSQRGVQKCNISNHHKRIGTETKYSLIKNYSKQLPYLVASLIFVKFLLNNLISHVTK